MVNSLISKFHFPFIVSMSGLIHPSLPCRANRSICDSSGEGKGEGEGEAGGGKEEFVRCRQRRRQNSNERGGEHCLIVTQQTIQRGPEITQHDFPCPSDLIHDEKNHPN